MNALLLNLDVLLLLLFGAGALAGGVSMIVLREPMRVAIALIATMICLAAIYGLLGVHFIAAFQVLIYVGAVMVFMVYAIVLLDTRDRTGTRFSRLLVPGVVTLALLLGLVLAGIWRTLPAPAGATGGNDESAFGIAKFSAAFLGEYWLHFEVTTVLLVAAVVAALAVIGVGRRSDPEKRHG
jgi:NADH-quinone oxidoreductase subunit J